MSEHSNNDATIEDPRVGRVARAFESFVSSASVSGAPAANDRRRTFTRPAPEPNGPPLAPVAAVAPGVSAVDLELVRLLVDELRSDMERERAADRQRTQLVVDELTDRVGALSERPAPALVASPSVDGAELDRDRDEVRGVVAELAADNAATRRGLEFLGTTVRDLLADSAADRTSVDVLRRTLETLDLDLQASLARVREAAREQRGEITEVRIALDQLTRAAARQNDDLTAEVTTLRQQLEGTLEAIDALTATVKRQAGQLTRLRSDLKAARGGTTPGRLKAKAAPNELTTNGTGAPKRA